MRHPVLFTAAPLLSLLFTLTTADADIWQILPDGTGDAPTIQAGIDSAANGDEVVLADGVFTGEGNRDIELRGKAITVRSGSGNPEACIIELFMDQYWITRRGFWIHEGEGPGTIVSGIAIQNGHIAVDEQESFGGAIFINGTSPKIVNCRFIDCFANWGGAVCIRSGGSPSVQGCEFRSNHANWSGGGLDTQEGNSGEVTNCRFIENQSQRGGGISIVNADLNMCESLFEDNNGGLFGGGIWSEIGSGEISDCVFRGNRCLDGAGMYMYNGCSHVISGSVFSGGHALTCGGILANLNNDLVIRETTIASNLSTISAYAGGLVFSGGSVELIKTNIWGNCTSNNYYAQDVTIVGGSVASLECCLFDPNEVGGAGTIEYIGTNVFEDPLFCDPVSCEDAPTTEGDYSLHADSPALDHPDCGLIGALGEGCGGTTSTEKTSWGGVKKLFR